MPKLLLTTTLLLAVHALSSINPLREYTIRPEDFNIPYAEERLQVDGTELNLWVMQRPVEAEKRTTVVIAGSDAGNMGFSLAYVRQLLGLGYDVVTFDYRGFGASADFAYKPDNLYHREYIADFVGVVQFAQSRFAANDTAVLAFSMGTLIAACGYQAAPYDALIAEGVVFAPPRNVSRIKELRGKDILLPEGYRADARAFAEIAVPMLIFSGTADQKTTHEDALEVAALGDNRQLVPFKGDHLRGVSTLGFAAYFREIEGFLDRK